MFYAYIPDAGGKEPLGTDRKIIRHDLRSAVYFVRYARRILGDSCRCYVIRGSFYDEKAHFLIYSQRKGGIRRCHYSPVES